ncbi:MAG: suppressor of fused domain protein, partial [Polyangia bacterium]
APEEFRFLQVGDGREVEFLAVVPITGAELEHKLQSGLGGLGLDALLRGAGVTELCEPNRPDVTQAKYGIGPSA